jgi:GNAT superfamily N-acetyltransferase
LLHSERAADSLPRALDFMRAVLAATADDARIISEGLVLTTPSLPTVWSANQLRVTEALAFESLVQLADEQLPQLGYVDIAVEDQVTGPMLEPAFRAAGWKVERDLVMVLSEPPDRPADTGILVDAGEDELMDLMDRWYAEDPGPTAAERVQLVDYNRREARVHGDRMLGVRSSDGQLVAMTKLRSDGSTAQAEDVYTVPEARGRGYARALVSRAVELAHAEGAGLTFIVADDNDWPKLLYGRIGFRPVGHVWHFHRS